MRRYAFLFLFPCGNNTSGNRVIDEQLSATFQDAVEYFSRKHLVPLNENGYFKSGENTYCIAQFFTPVEGL